MALQIYIDQRTPLPGGYKMVTGQGWANLYDGSGGFGCALNLSNELKSTGYPLVICGTTNGLVFEHNRGTAAAGRVRAFRSNLQVVTMSNADYQCDMVEHTNNGQLVASAGINVPFIAVGPAF